MTEGASRIAQTFEAAHTDGRSALMPYMLAAYPTIETSREVARAYVESGADLVEVGFPFSDPLADGPVIHAAATHALEAGAGLDDSFEVVASISGSVPVIAMCYINVILTHGVERFAERLAEAGAAGILIPDLPHGESPELEEAMRDRGIAPISLVAPTTTRERIRQICETAEGFVYLVSSVGTTGVRGELPAGLGELIESVRAQCSIPVAVGFGVGSPEQARDVGRVADGVIIGSRLVELATAENGQGPAGVADFLQGVATALRDRDS